MKTLVFILILILIAILTSFSPPEKSLGENVRLVYLHGAWVWTALVAFLASALSGLLGLLRHRQSWLDWSRALGRTGLLFWITYLPVSMWAMQANWNGLFLAEPRWRLALAFAVGGLLLQVGLALVDRPTWTALGNLAYILLLTVTLLSVENIMHPSSPIFSSGVLSIQIYFLTLLVLMLAAAGIVARSWMILHRRFVR